MNIHNVNMAVRRQEVEVTVSRRGNEPPLREEDKVGEGN